MRHLSPMLPFVRRFTDIPQISKYWPQYGRVIKTFGGRGTTADQVERCDASIPASVSVVGRLTFTHSQNIRVQNCKNKTEL